MAERACETVRDLMPELALGVSDGLERAAVLTHLERCPQCRAELEGLLGVVDGLTALAPPAEPPAGFESRVLASLGQVAPIRRWRRAVAAVAVAAAVALLGGVAGWAVHSRPATAPVTAALQAAGGSAKTLGEVVVVPGVRPWISVSLDTSYSSVRCEVQTMAGRTIDVGNFYGEGQWAARLPAGTQVRSARLVADGRVVATANVA